MPENSNIYAYSKKPLFGWVFVNPRDLTIPLYTLQSVYTCGELNLESKEHLNVCLFLEQPLTNYSPLILKLKSHRNETQNENNVLDKKIGSLKLLYVVFF